METESALYPCGRFCLRRRRGGFIFVYWLHNSAEPVAGALSRPLREAGDRIASGVAVLFNGLRVGEVRRVNSMRRTRNC